MTDRVSHKPPAIPASSMPSAPPSKADAAFLETIIGATEEMMWVVDAEKFGLLWWNGRVADFLGAMGVSLSMHLTADGADHGKMRVAELHSFYRRALDEGSFTVEDVMGPRYWLSLVFTPLLRDGVPYAVLATAHDITQRKRAELEREEALTRLAEEQRLLRIREGEQRLLMRHAPAAIFEVDLAGPSFIAVNDYGCEASGYSRDEFLALHPLALVDDGSRSVLSAGIRAMAEGHGAMEPVEYTLVKKDGATRLVVLTAAPLPTEGPPVRALAVGYDVTEQKAAQERLLHAEEKYRAVVETIHEGLAVLAEGKFLYANEMACRSLELTMEQCLTTPFADYLHPDDREWVMGVAADVVRTGKPALDVDFRVVTRSGRNIWLSARASAVDWEGTPATAALFQDITGRKMAQSRLEESEARFRRMADLAGVGICIVDEGGTMLYINVKGAEIFGRDPEEMLGRPNAEFIHPDDFEEAAAGFDRRLAGESPGDGFVFRILRKDGVPRQAEFRGQRIEFGDRPAVLGTFVDATERKAAEEQLERSELRYRTVVDNIQEGVVVSAANGDKLYFNDQLPRMLGCTNDEYAAASLISMVHPEDRGQVEWMQGALFQNGSPVSDFEARLVDKEGRVKWVRSKASLTDWLGQQAAVTFMDDVTAQVQAEAALKQSVDIVNSMFKSVQDAFYMATLDEGRFIELNHAFEELFGYARDELVGTTGLDLGLWADPSERSRMVEELRKHGHVRDFRAACRRRSGETFLCAFSTATCDIDGITCIVGFLRDETERLAAEEALRESEAGYRLLADNMVDVVWMADAESLRFTYVSPSCELLDGYKPEELIGTTIADRATLDLRAARTEVFRSMRERFESQAVPFLDDVRDLEILHKDGTPLWVDVRIRILRDPNTGNVAFLGLTRDKSKQRAAEDALRQKQEQLDRFFSLEVGLLCVSDLDGRFRLVSAGWETTLGRPKEEIVGRSMLDFVHPSDLQVTMEAMDRLRAQEEVVDLVNRLVGKDGNYRTISWRCAPAGELVYSAARDVTDLLAAEEQLRQSQKMEAIGQLAGGIAHDFNNLLTAILGYTDLLLASPEGHGEPLRLDLLEIKGAAKRAADLTQQILAFSRKQALRPEVICINDVLIELKPLLERLLGENVMLEVQTAERLGQCEIDPSQFTQVLINLIVNARDAMPQGGFLIMETANADLKKRGTPPALADLEPGGYVVLKCTDTGSGMDAETVSRIFEPFFTTKPAGEGTGLGLSTVHGIVHQSGGTVLVDSELGRGTVFTIYLPRISAGVTGETGSDEPSRSGRGHGTVLVVEDEESVAALARRVLVSHGYEVTTAANAVEALGALADTRKIDLLLTDMVLPGGMQGGELADTAKSVHPELRVLYMSGYSRASSIHGGRLSEGVNFLQKPFTPGALVANVEDVLAGRDRPAQAEPPPGIDKEAGSR